MSAGEFVVRERMREQEKARDFWKALSYEDRWTLGDQLVLGDFDWRDWLASKPSRVFLNELDQERILWEMEINS